MPKNTQSQFKPGLRISYNDGRPGHQAANAEILSVDNTGMLVQFSDRADTTRIQFNDKSWMEFIKPEPAPT